MRREVATADLRSSINRIVSTSLRQRFLIAFFAILLTGAGIYSFRRLPVHAYSDLYTDSRTFA
jgi:Cu/Ag efflux pump CusA